MNVTPFLPLGALVALPLAASPFSPDPLRADRDVASLAPARTLIYVEAPGLPALLEEGLDHPFLGGVLRSELGEMLLADAGGSPEDLLAFGEAMLGRPVLPTLACLGARGVALGLTPVQGGVGWNLVLHADDDVLVDEMLDYGSTLLETETGISDFFGEPQNVVRGADMWLLGEDLVVARRDALVVLGSNEGYVRDVLDLAADEGSKGLLGRADFRAARDGRPDDALLWAYADRERIEKVMKMAGQGDQLADFANMGSRPDIQFLLGPGIAALGRGKSYSAALRLDGRRLGIDLRASGAAVDTAIAPSADAPLPSFALAEVDDCASGLLYRDFAGIYEHRADLFPADQLPAIVKGMSELALIFGGKDLGEEVLPHLSPWIGLVSRPVAFEEGVAPEIELPAAAALVEVDDPEATGATLVSAFHTFLSIINIERAQEGMAQLVPDIDLEGDVKIISAHFPAPRMGDGVDIQYNLKPACAIVGRTFVLGTHEDLVRDVVRDLAAGEGRTRTAAAPVERLRLSGPELAHYVELNFDALVMQKVYEEGVSVDESRAEMDGLRAVLELVDHLGVEVRYAGDGVHLAADLELVPQRSVSEGSGESEGSEQ